MTSDDAEPTFTIRASMPGAAKALRTIAANVRTTNHAQADEIDLAATAFERHLQSRTRPGAGYIPKR